MDDEWYDGYDGGMYSGGGTKGSRKKTRIPRFKSIIRKGYRGGRSRRSKVSDSETTILIWVVISLVVSALFHAEWIFTSLYALVVLYTLLTKDHWLIRFVSVILTTIGILFFVAISLAVLFNLMAEHNILKDPATMTAYAYIIKVPLLSWSIIWLLENWEDWFNKRIFATGKFVEKQKSSKLLLQKLAKLCFAASIVILIMGVIHFIYTLFNWGFWVLTMFSINNTWTSFIIGITLLGKFSEWLAKKLV